MATLVIALSMNTGFRETLQDRLLGVTAHISLTRPGTGGIRDYEALASETSADSGSAHRNAGRVSDGADVVRRRSARRGHERELIPRASKAQTKRCESMVAGKLDFSPDADGIDALLVGKQLADEWKLSPGDYVTLTSPQGRLDAIRNASAFPKVSSGGNFRFGILRLRRELVFSDFGCGASSCRRLDVVNVLEFRLENPEAAPAVAENREASGAGFSATTWMERKPALFRALRMEKLVTAIFIGLITFVAGLNILVVLSMTVTDRRGTSPC